MRFSRLLTCLVPGFRRNGLANIADLSATFKRAQRATSTPHRPRDVFGRCVSASPPLDCACYVPAEVRPLLVIHQLTWRCVPDLRLRRTFKVNMQNKPNSTALRAPRRRIREKYLVAMSCAAAAACTCSPSAFVTLLLSRLHWRASRASGHCMRSSHRPCLPVRSSRVQQHEPPCQPKRVCVASNGATGC